jgi:predicted ribosomally synthesized peptide with nif11-like leader
MTHQAFVDFCAKVAQNADLRKKIDTAESPTDIVQLGAQSGFVFSEKDVRDGSQELAEQSEIELSEDQLSSLSGGDFGAVIGVIKVGLQIYLIGKKYRHW